MTLRIPETLNRYRGSVLTVACSLQGRVPARREGGGHTGSQCERSLGRISVVPEEWR